MRSGNTLYGTTQQGGRSYGVVYSVNTDGSAFTVLHAFTNGLDGSGPVGGLVLVSNVLYGTSFQGGAGGGGVLFGLTVSPPALMITSITLAGTNLVLAAANGMANQTYTLLTSTNLALPLAEWIPAATNVLSTNGNFTITATNAVAPLMPQQFYILQAQ
jgi:uncharacterized repeat protein (TIGR03803 family)